MREDAEYRPPAGMISDSLQPRASEALRADDDMAPVLGREFPPVESRDSGERLILMTIDSYLRWIEVELVCLEAREVGEILLELRGHLVDRAAETGELAAVAGMGDPQELAGLYLRAALRKECG